MEFVDLGRQYQAYKLEIDEGVQEVLNSSQFIMGRKVEELEARLADFVGAKCGIGVASGTDALLLSLMAKGVGPRDEIITIPFTFISPAAMISLLGAKPVFVDIDEETYNINPSLIEERITDETKGIIAVNIFGQPAEYDEIDKIAQKHDLFVIEDAAQSFGAEYRGKKSCSLAELSCTSFYPAKPLGCYGDGGMVFTNDESLAKMLRSLRRHGMSRDEYENVRVGTNARLDTIQAAVLLAKFNHFGEEMEMRQKLARRYDQGLRGLVTTPRILDHNRSAYAVYSIRTRNRDEVQAKLKEKGIPTAIYYPKPLHLQKAFSGLNYKEGDFPVTGSVAKEILALPVHPFLLEKEQNYIIDTLRSVLE